MVHPLPAISFRPVTAADINMLAEWMRRPHWREWWGDPEEEIGFIRDMIEGRDTTEPYLILLEGQPVGYIQVWYVGHHQNEEWVTDNPWLSELPAEAVGVDLSLADPERLSRGIGSAALATFTRQLRERGHRTIIIDPDPVNERAVRAYRKAGYRPMPELVGRSGDSVIMQFQESTQEPRP